MESEKKLKILSMLNVVSKLKVSVTDFIANCGNSSSDVAASIVVVSNAGLYDRECDVDVPISEAECKSLIFV